jgi:hypothetical protein
MGRLDEAEQDLARALSAFDPTRLEEHIASLPQAMIRKSWRLQIFAG